MTRLHDEMSVDCTIAETQARLDAFFASLRTRDGTARIRLRVPITSSPSSYGIAIGREVRVEARHKRDEERDMDVVEIAWKPEGTSVFPHFEGTLAVKHDHAPERCTIELDGCYTPPFGAAGQVFDAAIGQQIAHATAREFLRDLKSAIEAPAR